MWQNTKDIYIVIITWFALILPACVPSRRSRDTAQIQFCRTEKMLVITFAEFLLVCQRQTILSFSRSY